MLWLNRDGARSSHVAPRERSVGEIVSHLRLEQPSVSKHLQVLKAVGLVQARREGRSIFYRANGEAIRPLHEWTSSFERLWQHQLRKIRDRAAR
jgi:DNA-binding transcriptional ArsR family regulator